MFLSIKITYLSIICITCFIGGSATILLKKFCNSSKNIFSYLNCLGGGILLGAAFLHLLSDSEEFLISDYPYSNLIFAFGFFTSFILERVLFEHSHDHDIILPNSLTSVVVTSGNEEEDQELIMSEFEMEEKEDTDNNNHHDHEQDNNGHSHNHHSHKLTKKSSTLEKGKFPFILFSVLSLESFISGMALAIEEDKILISITFIAIITHIWAEAFALHISVIKAFSISNDNSYIFKKVIISSILFSFMTPIGGAFGLISEYILNQNQIDQISGILLAFAGGCFLYVAVFEIMNEEFSSHNHHHHHHHHVNSSPKTILISKLIKLLLLLIGFSFMAVIADFV